MNPVEQQFKVLKEYWPEATLQALADGTYLISVRNIKLPEGWSKQLTAIHFIVPVGYPLARPDCFWTDPDLLLANGSMPQNTGVNPIPNVEGNHLWFSWHLTNWNANNDNLMTYLNVIKRRLQEQR